MRSMILHWFKPQRSTTTEHRASNLFDNPNNGAAAGPPLGPSSSDRNGNTNVQGSELSGLQLLRAARAHAEYRAGGWLCGHQRASICSATLTSTNPRWLTRLANPTVDANALVPSAGYQAIVSRAPDLHQQLQLAASFVEPPIQPGFDRWSCLHLVEASHERIRRTAAWESLMHMI